FPSFFRKWFVVSLFLPKDEYQNLFIRFLFLNLVFIFELELFLNIKYFLTFALFHLHKNVLSL
ncbi:MAG TPA: hypothetical protein DEP71_06180, partial [Porphyromonadaceae bacterium]|nr:hypothetical protein [Porphyromonadaceae bacterium]HCB88854.1 hypothetical protein [Porphyromonadaceae bacterium]